MFERYTEKARRVIFFARYEASQFGSPEIESEHLLLGLLREGKGTLHFVLGLKASEEEIRAEIAAATTQRRKTSTSVDLPLTNEGKRILAFAAEEAQRLHSKHIGLEHLALGILREKDCLAARVLRQHGVQLDQARTQIAAAEKEAEAGGGIGAGESGAPRRLAMSTGLIELSGSEFQLSYHNGSLVPRIGEKIAIHEADGKDRSYLIQDVIWEFNREKTISQLQAVKLKVVEENENSA